MALLNNLYIFVEDEEVSNAVESTSHPVEQGIDITDHVQRKPIELSLKGKIVDYGSTKAADVLQRLKEWQRSGSMITFKGRNVLYDLQIQDFTTTHPYSNWGGCDYSMTLKEVRIAKSAYVAPKKNSSVTNCGIQQISKGENTAVYHTVKAGDNIWNLVSGAYKTLTPKGSNTMDKCNWVMAQNPSAFSKKGDFRTLQVGQKILIGYR